MRAMSSSEAPQGTTQGTEHVFQAETRQLLDIVTNSLYTDKEVFLRELISNASDALEKLRHFQSTGMDIHEPDVPLEILITVDKEAKTLTITDTGVGLSESEMMQNLGTIARSGSKAFVNEMKEEDAASSIIGQFGVGFYSAFMVGNTVEVTSKPATIGTGQEANVWSSDGTGSYTIAAAPEDAAKRGSQIKIHMKDDAAEFLDPTRLKAVISKYSNFVNFPIKVEGEVVNTVQALWTQMPSQVSEEDYTSFYRFISDSFDEPTFRIHMRADAPVDLKVLLFLPSYHMEKWGEGHMDPGVSLYTRKVLLEKNSAGILPDWLRFVKGVVDSEDLPLSISREKAQDSRLLAKISHVLVRRILKTLADKASKEPDAYKKWFKEFGVFLKEGVCRDFANQQDIAKLLFFESSSLDAGELTSLDEYVSRLTPEQDQIHYLFAPNRTLAEESPYFETFKKNKREVIFVYNAIDDFVMTNLQTFNKRKIVSAEAGDVNLGDDETPTEDSSGSSLSDEKIKDLGEWIKQSLPNKIKDVQTTNRLSGSPAIITDHESGALRRMMRMVEQQNSGDQQMSASDLPPQTLQINPSHPIIVDLDTIRHADPAIASLVVEQIVDNALSTAGLLDDSRAMITRINALTEKLLNLSRERMETNTDK